MLSNVLLILTLNRNLTKPTNQRFFLEKVLLVSAHGRIKLRLRPHSHIRISASKINHMPMTEVGNRVFVNQWLRLGTNSRLRTADHNSVLINLIH